MKKVLSFLAAALMCMAVNAQTAFSENFDGIANNGPLPTGWKTYGDGLANYGNYASFNDSWQIYNEMALSISWTVQATACDRWLVTPQISVPVDNPMLTLNAVGLYDPITQPQYAEKLKVMVSTTDQQKASFTLLEDLGGLAVDMNAYAVDLAAYAGQSVYLAFVQYGDGEYLFMDDIEVQSLPSYGVSVVSARADWMVAAGGNDNVTVIVKNTGYDTLTSFDIEYTINGTPATTINVTGISVPTFATYSYTIPYTQAEAGAVTFAITVTNPNGETIAGDTTIIARTTFYSPEQSTQRMTLLEHFTTNQCVWCPLGHERMEAAMGQQNFEERIAWVAHHVGYGTDVWTNAASKDIMVLYGGSSWAPAMALDRNHNYFSDEEGAVGSVGAVNDIVAGFTQALALPAITTVNISNLNYDEQSRELAFDVTGQLAGDMNMYDPRVTVYLIEDGLHSTQAGVNEEQSASISIPNYTNNHVVRRALSASWGDEDVITDQTAGSTFSKHYTFTLPTAWRAHKVSVVAFVNDYGQTILDRQVMNATKTGYLLNHVDPTTTTSISGIEASIGIKTYPNPVTEMAYVSAESPILSFEVVNSLGQKVLQGEGLNTDLLELNVSNMAAGVYFVTVTTIHGVATERLTVVK